VVNYCTACGNDFTSLRLFDAHRVGKHEFLASEQRPHGRRCLTQDEMLERGWVRHDSGGWIDPTRVEDARQRFAAAA